jgi:DNA-binding NarL/FixJ family response regulator
MYKGAASTLGKPLSLCESRVTALVAKGLLNKEVAYQLHITEGTVKEYVHRVFRKVGVTNRTELALWALRQ